MSCFVRTTKRQFFFIRFSFRLPSEKSDRFEISFDNCLSSRHNKFMLLSIEQEYFSATGARLFFISRSSRRHYQQQGGDTRAVGQLEKIESMSRNCVFVVFEIDQTGVGKLFKERRRMNSPSTNRPTCAAGDRLTDFCEKELRQFTVRRTSCGWQKIWELYYANPWFRTKLDFCVRKVARDSGSH